MNLSMEKIMSDKGTTAKIGDVFRIPITDEESGFGWIMAAYHGEMLLMVIFARKAGNSENLPLNEIVSSAPLFISNSLDAKIWHGHWTVLGNIAPDVVPIPEPNYKVK